MMEVTSTAVRRVSFDEWWSGCKDAPSVSQRVSLQLIPSVPLPIALRRTLNCNSVTPACTTCLLNGAGRVGQATVPYF